MKQSTTCCGREEAAIDYVLGEMDPQARVAFTAHMDTCDACCRLVADYQGVQDHLTANAALDTSYQPFLDALHAEKTARVYQNERFGLWHDVRFFITTTPRRLPAWGLSVAAHVILIFTFAHMIFQGKTADRTNEHIIPMEREVSIKLTSKTPRSITTTAVETPGHLAGQTKSHLPQTPATPPMPRTPVSEEDHPGLKVPERLAAPEIAMPPFEVDMDLKTDADVLKIPVAFAAMGDVRDVPEIYRARVDPVLKFKRLKEKGGLGTQEMVQGGLAYLAGLQQADGSWDMEATGGDSQHTVGLQALVLLSFLGDGHTHAYGRFAKTVHSGVRHMLTMQDRQTGRIGETYHRFLYGHALATIVFAEDFAMTGSRDLRLQDALARAVNYLRKDQRTDGGWGTTAHSDPLATSWVVMALRAASAAGIAVPSETLAKAATWLDTTYQGGQGSMANTPTPLGSGQIAGMVTARMLARMDTITKEDKGIARLLQAADQNVDDEHNGINRLLWYHGSQAMVHVGGKEWAHWNALMRKAVTRDCKPKDFKTYAWEKKGLFASEGGVLYTTAVSILTLESYYTS